VHALGAGGAHPALAVEPHACGTHDTLSWVGCSARGGDGRREGRGKGAWRRGRGPAGDRPPSGAEELFHGLVHGIGSLL
jgi:hypothetical protein